LIQQMMGVKLPPDMEKEVGAMQDKVAGIVSDAPAWDKPKPAYLKVYLDAYSEEERDGIIAFCKSPAGQAMVTKTPALMAKSSGIVGERIADVQPELTKLMTDFGSQVRQRLGDKQGPIESRVLRLPKQFMVTMFCGFTRGGDRNSITRSSIAVYHSSFNPN